MNCRVCSCELTEINYKDKSRGFICRNCVNEYQKERRRKRPKEVKVQESRKSNIYHRMKVFGLSVEDYDKMFFLQDGKCAICRHPETETRSGILIHLAVDHDHKTGAIRGLLCGKCNKMLGQVNDNPEILKNAIEYLERMG